jgi:hypothetical protein
MRGTILIGMLTTTLAAPAAAGAADHQADDLVLTVRTYGVGSLHEADWHEPADRAGATLRRAGIQVQWVACNAAASSHTDNRCLTAPEPGSLVVRFVRLPQDRRARTTVSLANSLIDPASDSGLLATVYVNRVQQLAKWCAVPAGTLLGRVVAHEIVHLLIGSRGHAPAGLMRAAWSPKSIRSGHEADWEFTAAEVSAMRLAVRARGWSHVITLAALGKSRPVSVHLHEEDGPWDTGWPDLLWNSRCCSSRRQRRAHKAISSGPPPSASMLGKLSSNDGAAVDGLMEKSTGTTSTPPAARGTSAPRAALSSPTGHGETTTNFRRRQAI